MALLDRKLMAQQKTGIKIARDLEGRAGIFMAPGTGKTLTAIRYCQSIRDDCLALVICRRDDFLTWKLELEEDGYSERSMVFISSGQDSLTVDTSEIHMDTYIRWVVVTYDLLKNPDVASVIYGIMFDIVIADESHMIKHWSSERAKKVIAVTRHIPKRLAMTGTPITNDPQDVFTQALFIDDGQTFGANYYSFREFFYIKSGFGWYIRKGAKDVIREKLAKIAYYVDEDDVMKLPKKRTIIKSCPMAGKQRRHYEKVLNEWETQLSDGTRVEIDYVIVQIAKLRQIASGFMYVDGKPIWFKSPKLDMLDQALQDSYELGNKKKIVIWCSHTAEIEKILKLVKTRGIKAVGYYGSNRKKKVQARLDFKNKKSVRLFVGQVDSGVGMNELVVADTAVYFSNSTKMVSRKQSEARIRRRGSEIHKRITYYDYVVEGSIDLTMLKSIRHMRAVAGYICDQLKRGKHLRSILAE
jgi:SNF2 family DNA or RNA helicase